MTFLEFIDHLKTCLEPIRMEEFPGEFGFTDHADGPIRSIGYATNHDPRTVAKAVELGVDALLTHHDAWEFLYELRTTALHELEQAGISHTFVHLPLDAAPFGTAATLAGLLELKIFEDFARYEGLPCGRVCEASRDETLDALASRMRTVTKGGVRVWRFGPETARRIGITTGGGSLTDILHEAAGLGCDTYITGEANLYTVQYARHLGLNLLIGTHTHTEFPGVESLAKRLQAATGLDFVPIHEDDIESGTPA